VICNLGVLSSNLRFGSKKKIGRLENLEIRKLENWKDAVRMKITGPDNCQVFKSSVK